jgi:VanZ family protein
MGDGFRNKRKWKIAFWIIWIVYVGAWTTALLTPHPARAAQTVLPGPDLRYIVAKSLHVAAYLVLTVLTGALPIRSPWRYLMLALPSVHAMATEFFQQFVPERTGSWADVGFDHIGICFGLGLLLVWIWYAPNPGTRQITTETCAAWKHEEEAIR